MSDIEFHYEFVDIFMALRDFHTTYELPGPHRCVENYKAVAFDIIGSGSDEKIIVSSFYDKRILALSPSAGKLRIGDELISISGTSVFQLIYASNYTKGGANNAGTLRAALKSFSMIDGKIHRLPLSYNEKYRFRRADGTLFMIQLPWISAVDYDCWQQSKPLVISTRPSSFILPIPLLRVSDNNNLFKLHDDTPIQTPGSTIEWSIHQIGTKTMGVITLNSFVTQDLEIDLLSIRELLLGVLKDTDALLFDVRSNIGGMIGYADKIPQLFGIDIKTGFFRALNSPVNANLFMEPLEGVWAEATRNTIKDKNFTPLVKVVPDEEVNFIGQAYLKPVGVLTDGKCYSTCEIFAANMKDNNIGTIFGEDYTTGGGGASFVDYKYLSGKQHFYFPPIPFSDQIPRGTQNFKVALKQFVRLDGSLIEDIGILSDYIVRPEANDLKLPTRSGSQYARISEILFEQAMYGGTDQINFEIEPKDFNLICEIGFDLHINFISTGFTNILIYDQSGMLLHHKMLDHLHYNLKTSFTLPTGDQSRRLEKLNFGAYDYDGNLAFNTWKQIKFVPAHISYLQIDRPMNFQLTSDSNYVGVYDMFNRGEGWILSNHHLIIYSYGRKVKSVISYFLQLIDDERLVSIKGSYLVNNIHSSLRIGFTESGVTNYIYSTRDQVRRLENLNFGAYDYDGNLVFPSENLNEQKSVSFADVHLIPSGEIELFFEFEADGLFLSGATVESINVL